MNRRIVILSAFLSFLLSSSEIVIAGIPIPIIWGQDEKITDLGEVSPEVARPLAKELGTEVRVGFLYDRFHIFWLDAWTSNGRHVLYSGDRYWIPTTSEWSPIAGGDPVEKYGTPLLYRIPLGPAIASVIVVCWIIQQRVFKSDVEKLNALLKDQRYQRSLEILFGATSGKVITKLEEDRFHRAVDYLSREGIATSTAEANLRKIADCFLANTNSQIDRIFESAAVFEKNGDWDNCAAIYSQLIASLPHDDERLAYAQNCLAAVNAKQTAHSMPDSN